MKYFSEITTKNVSDDFFLMKELLWYSGIRNWISKRVLLKKGNWKSVREKLTRLILNANEWRNVPSSSNEIIQQ